MYIYHYAVSSGTSLNELETILKQNKIDYEKIILTVAFNQEELIFDIPENHPNLAEIQRYIPEPNRSETLSPLEPQAYLGYFREYSEEEFRNAKWVSIRCANSKIVNATNGIYDSYCYAYTTDIADKYIPGKGYTRKKHDVMRHNKLNDSPFIIKKPPQWRNKSFMSYEFSEHVLFCSNKTHDMLEQAGMKGIDYVPVYNKTSKEPLDDIYQMKPKYTIPDKAIVSVSDMNNYICDTCGMNMLAYIDTKGIYGVLKDKIDSTMDFCVTEPMFLASIDNPTSAHFELIISQRMYRFIKDNHMDRGLFFEPIPEIE